MKTKPKPKPKDNDGAPTSIELAELERAMAAAHRHADTNRALAAHAKFAGMRTQASARAYWWDGYATCLHTLIKRINDEKAKGG